ncbi:MAG: hypothetical protein WBQ25_00345 [Nitrososphaeraceae archaeon]
MGIVITIVIIEGAAITMRKNQKEVCMKEDISMMFAVVIHLS